ncbi:MAG TPA: 1-acyl-sn-glycerol-3-phosphate acyltransferase [Firmicutes bacterium]|jgi:1-acyl-sn-glycerol-3-phosphate acyltransferase|nr:1-acyl-sn-glycerol-3-phosphate acyltransferase [Bacillota bacterium]
MLLYRFAKMLLAILLKIFYRIEVKGGEYLPPKGPVICVANHASLVDPIVMGCSLKRSVNFLAKEELFRIPVLNWILKTLGVIPVKRGAGDRGALKSALKVLEDKKVLGLFPEGTRYRDNTLHPLRPGAAMLALQTGACILPMLISGTYRMRFLSFPKIKVAIGPPFTLSAGGERKERIRAGTQEIYAHLAALSRQGEGMPAARQGSV